MVELGYKTPPHQLALTEGMTSPGRTDMTKPICSITWCERNSGYSNGYCAAHYQRAKAGSDMDAPFRVRRLVVPCAFDGCERPHFARGHCDWHRKQVLRGLELTPILTPYVEKLCSLQNCNRPQIAKELCSLHYSRQSKGKNLQDVTWRSNGAGYQVWSVRDRKGNTVQLSQHRMVMESSLGRPLVEGENVHHINGDRADNRIENLELWNTRQPAGQRAEDKADWAIEILRLYRPEALARNGLHIAPQLAA